VFLAGYNELNYQLKSRGETSESEPVRIQNLESVARALVRATNAEVLKLERRLPFLATTGSATPFIGLFGTVWGIMASFHGIGLKGSATLAVVAPGISEALVATAAGLGAAIPAVVAYNHYVNRVRGLETEMANFANDLLNIIKRDILRRFARGDGRPESDEEFEG
jgi:biopolymer transport protein TolQ